MPSLRPESMRAWAGRCAALAVVLGVVLFAVALRDAVVCDASFQELAEPPGWSAWPALPDLGGLAITQHGGPCVGHGIQCGLANTELRDRELCPRGGVSLDAWFDPQGIYGSARDISLREQGGVFVAAGSHSTGTAAVFVVAFERVRGLRHPALRTKTSVTIARFLGGALGSLLLAAFVTWRRLKTVAAYADRARFRGGTLRASDVLRFDEDASPHVVIGGAHLLPGRVLVRARRATPSTYRTTGEILASDLVMGDLESLRATAEVRCARTLRRAFIAAIVCGVVAGLSGVGSWIDESGALRIE